MNKKLTTALLGATVALPVMAGGLVTNTNQNAAFLRQLSQDAVIDITGMYANPAGTAFLAPGYHLSLNVQNARQHRDITTTFPLFALNTKDPGQTTRKYEGLAYAPVIPSVHFSYNWEKWSINANFSLGGGGGKCEFDNGIGSFEALYAGNLYSLIPASVRANVKGQLNQAFTTAGLPAAYASQLVDNTTVNAQMTGYSLNEYMKGRQYYFGLHFGATYKVLDNLAVFGGVRAVYAANNYNGWVENIKANYKYDYTVPAVAGVFPGKQDAGQGEQTLDAYSLSLNVDQTGLGFTPMIGADWKLNEQWNFAFKYEFKTRLRFENKAEMNDYTKKAAETNATLAQFKDGAKVAADIPSVLFVGAQYSPIQPLRINAGFHYYGDKNATQYGDKQKLIDNNTWEITAGAEYDINKWVTASIGGQITRYGLSDAYMNDISFTTNSNSYGLGVRVHVTEKCNIDLGFMQTLYDTRDVTTKTAAGNKVDSYKRTNRVLGIGVNFDF